MEIIEITITNEDNGQSQIQYQVNNLIFSTREDAQNYIDTYSSMDL